MHYGFYSFFSLPVMFFLNSFGENYFLTAFFSSFDKIYDDIIELTAYYNHLTKLNIEYTLQVLVPVRGSNVSYSNCNTKIITAPLNLPR